jgi:hypothetical protein
MLSKEALADPGQAVAAYLEKRWGGPTRLVPFVSIAVLTMPTKIVTNNPRRFEWIAVNVGVGTVTISWDTSLAAGSQIPIPPLGGSIIVLADEDGEMVTYDAWAIAAAAGNTLWVAEVIRK